MKEPVPPEPDWPRYSTRPFPPYRFLPGHHPHPRRSPQGHSYGLSEPRPPACRPEDWPGSDWYLYGVDLFNFSYWWECHEVFEGFWHAAGHHTEQGRFFQGLIQVAAANLKWFLGKPAPAMNLTRSALARLQTVPQVYMGLNVAAFIESIGVKFGRSGQTPVLIRLIFPSQPQNGPQ